MHDLDDILFENSDCHEELIKAFMQYCAANTAYEQRGAYNSSVNARRALSRIVKLAHRKRREIQNSRDILHSHRKKITDKIKRNAGQPHMINRLRAPNKKKVNDIDEKNENKS